MERVVQFDTKRKTLPRFDIPPSYPLETGEIRKKGGTAAAWLSSARAVRCALKWDNERNPCPMLYVSLETAPFITGRKEGMTSSQHGAYALGYTHPTMAKNNETRGSNAEQISCKFRLSSD